MNTCIVIYGRNLQQFFTIRYCLLGTLFYVFLLFLLDIFLCLFVFIIRAVGPRSSRLNIFFGMYTAAISIVKKSGTMFNFFLFCSHGCCYLSADFCLWLFCNVHAFRIPHILFMYESHCICTANGRKACTNNQRLAHFVVFHAYLMLSELCAVCTFGFFFFIQKKNEKKRREKSTFCAFLPFQFKCMPDRFCNKLRRWGKYTSEGNPKTEWHGHINSNNTAVSTVQYSQLNNALEKNWRMKNGFICKYFSIEHCIKATGMMKPECFYKKLKCRSWLRNNHVLSWTNMYARILKLSNRCQLGGQYERIVHITVGFSYFWLITYLSLYMKFFATQWNRNNGNPPLCTWFCILPMKLATIWHLYCLCALDKRIYPSPIYSFVQFHLEKYVSSVCFIFLMCDNGLTSLDFLY